MTTNCAKCGGMHFELKESIPADAQYKIYVVQCSQCGAPIGIMDYFDNNTLIQIVINKVDSLNAKIDQIDYDLSEIKKKI